MVTKAGRGSIWNAPFGRRWRRNAYGCHGKGAGISGGSCVLLVSFCRRNTGCFVYSSVLAMQQAGIPETQGIQGGKRILVL